MHPFSEIEYKNFQFRKKFDFYIPFLDINFIKNVNFNIKKNIINTKNVNLTMKDNRSTSQDKQARWLILNSYHPKLRPSEINNRELRLDSPLFR